MLLAKLLRALEHVFMDRIKQLCGFHRYIIDFHRNLFSCVAADDHAFALFNILRSDLHTERESAHLLLGKLPSG